MSEPVRAVWNGGGTWNSGIRWKKKAPPTVPVLLPTENFALNSNSHSMEPWEVNKQRAEITLPLWIRLLPTLRINGQGPTDLNSLIQGYEPAVQARTAAQDTFDEAYRNVQDALLKMKILGTKVPQIIEGLLDENAHLMKDVNDLYATAPRTEATILKRARDLHPVWVRANAALAALTPSQGPITRPIAGVVWTAATLKTLVDGYTELHQAMQAQSDALEEERSALRVLDRSVDQLSKRWYKVAKASLEEGTEAYGALAAIPTEGGTPAPDPVEIATVTQGGEGGLQVLLAYVPGGGDHATTKLVKWQVVGVDAGFDHSAPWDASGNALGPFAVGKVVKVLTEMSNSSGTRSAAARTITIGPPIV